jgi:two-component system chemotaxis response regulator CheB
MEPFAVERGDRLQPRDIVVIGGSAGSIEALQTIVQSLPPDFPASVFAVTHIPPDSPTMLPELLSKIGPLQATHPLDEERIQRGHIYVARPDHHLTIEDGNVRVLRGPRENRHRPAIDPLFRTAAREYGPRVVGIVLSGLRDDGSAGLYAVKQRGGITIVQAPNDAIWKDMPQRAIEYVDPQYVLPSRDIGPSLVQLANSREVELAMAKKNSVSRKYNGGNEKKKSASS